MRRTTICRSSASFTFALLFAGAATVPAQNPPPAPPPAAQQPAPAAPTGPLPAVHVVQPGETLWGLAQQYFGDALLWPEIYRLNTDVIEDPHWIFPGEELRLQQAAVAVEPAPGAPTVVTVTPQGDTTRAPQAEPALPPPTSPTIFAPRARVENREALETQTDRSYRGVRAGEYYSASFLTENAALPTGRLLGNVQASAIRRLSTASSAQLYTEVALALRRGGELRGYGDVIVPTGLLQVTGGSATRAAARVIALYGAVTDGQEVMRIAPYRMPASVRPVDVTDGVTGQVIGLVKPGDVVNLQDGIFLNRGTQEGVRLGDVFQITGTDRTRTDFSDVQLPQAQAVVVNVRPHTSTAIIVSLQRPDVRAGSAARQIRRLPT
jgi:hypothetical protein